jgi:hypothetical protein
MSCHGHCTTIDQTPKINTQHIMKVGPSIHPDAPAFKVQWKPEYFFIKGWWRSQCSSLAQIKIADSCKACEGDRVHRHYFTDNFKSEEIDGSQNLATSYSS